MLWITLDECKTQVRVPTADTTHDTDLTRLANGAETWLAKRLNKISAAALEEFGLSGTSPPLLPEDLKGALLMHVEAHFDRSAEDAPFLLKAAENLLQPYRVDGIGV